MMDKKQVRRDIRLALKSMQNDQRISMSDSVFRQIESLPSFRESSVILLYWSMPEEVITHDVVVEWSRTKTILLPVVVGELLELRFFDGVENMRAGKFDILEPVGKIFSSDSYSSIDLCIVPGVAFDMQGHRMGHGCGYYDRLLPLVSAPKIGVAYPCQILQHIDSEPWDVMMDMVVVPR